jgi:CBS domain containing-hemolysin-like protein
MDFLFSHILLLTLAALLLFLNAFFVAAEFALVKLRMSRVEVLVAEGVPFSKTLDWLFQRLDAALAACQFGITLASLGLGWIGEPAFAGLIEKPLAVLGIGSPVVVHTIAFVVAFSVVTALHITIGEQVPKIYAIRKSEKVALLCALPLKIFYLVFYPFLAVLNHSSNFLLCRLGLKGAGGHDAPHSEEEIRRLLAESRTAGELSRTELRLTTAVFEFDELLARQVMVPGKDIIMVDVDTSSEDLFALIDQTRHSRYPVYEGSANNVIGILHIKELTGKSGSEPVDIRAYLRPIQKFPETISISKILTDLQKSKVHMGLATDEYGTVVGAITLEDILEKLVGAIQDEFDTEPEQIVKEGDDAYRILGSTPLLDINDRTGLTLSDPNADSISGFIVDALDRKPAVGDTLSLGEGFVAEVLEVDEARIAALRITKE